MGVRSMAVDSSLTSSSSLLQEMQDVLGDMEMTGRLKICCLFNSS